MAHPIPDAALAQHIAILGKTGSGKTYAAKGVVENILREGGRVCVIDPTGAWHGLRSSATGKSAGFPVVIFGGANADLPLGAAHGEAMAEIIGTSSTPAIIDTSLMRVGERTRFFADFADAMVRKNKGPLHLVIDEAHLFAPQGKVNDPQSGAMLHAANNLVSLGRSRGLRIILITQRPAKLHKDSLTQVETLVALRLIAPQDRKAVEEWIKDNADEKKGREIIESLAKLPTGQGWVWAPEIDLLERVTFPKIKTFDTSRAPDADEASAGVVLAPIDRGAIEKRLQTVAADALANDPKALKAELAKLRRELADKPKPNGIDHDAVRQAEAAAYARGKTDGYTDALKGVAAESAAVIKALESARSVASQIEHWSKQAPPAFAARAPVAPRPAPARAAAAPAAAPADGLTTPQRRVMTSLAFWKSIGHAAPTREQVAAVAGYRPGSGNFNNIIGGLSTMGQTVVPSPGCLALNVEYEGLSLDEARDKLWSVLENPQRKLVEAAKDADTDLTRDELAVNAGYAPGSGNFNNITGRLTSMDILQRTGTGRIALSNWAREVLQ